MTSKKSFREQEQVYWEYRQIASELVLPDILSLTSLNVKLSDINASALEQVLRWRKLYLNSKSIRKPGWDWAREVAKYRRRPRRIELAIWVDEGLCGLVIGRVSDKRVVASIHLMESKPSENELAGEIAIIATRWLTVFAGIISCRMIAIDRPLPNLIEFYKELGYAVPVMKGRKIIRLVSATNS